MRTDQLAGARAAIADISKGIEPRHHETLRAEHSTEFADSYHVTRVALTGFFRDRAKGHDPYRLDAPKPTSNWRSNTNLGRLLRTVDDEALKRGMRRAHRRIVAAILAIVVLIVAGLWVDARCFVLALVPLGVLVAEGLSLSAFQDEDVSRREARAASETGT